MDSLPQKRDAQQRTAWRPAGLAGALPFLRAFAQRVQEQRQHRQGCQWRRGGVIIARPHMRA
eukprot:8294020-Alexandrium_andersonii.AAC.1